LNGRGATGCKNRGVTQTAPPRDSMMRKLFRTVGIVMIASGLAILGWFAWQYFGTNVVSHQKQQKILSNWTNSEAVGILRVPRFGADYKVPIIPGGNLIEPKGLAALSKGVAWYEPGAKPGQVGNFVIAGHRVTHGEPFKDFPKLRAGDKVSVETRDSFYTYVLRNGGTDIIVPFTAAWPLQAVPDPHPPATGSPEPTKAVLTMVTCSELFHTNNRSVVIGDLKAWKAK
jgi:sortase A